MDFAGKRLLILGGASVHCKIVRAAKQMGIYTIVADYLTDSPAKKIADESLLISILDVDAIVDWCKANPVDGVINYSNDPAQKAHQQICERLGLPCYGTAEQVNTLSDKAAFKELCVKCGVGVIPTYTEQDVALGNAEYPLLVKPSDSRGSRGQTVCYCQEETLSAISFAKSESFSGNITIERFMGNCDDLQLVYLVSNGEPSLVKVEDRYRGMPENHLDRLCIATVCPSKHERIYRQKANDCVISMIKHLGIKNGPVFLQGFWVNETIMLYDPGIRLPGDDFDYAYQKATNICIPELLIQYALSGVFPDDTAAKVASARITDATAMILPCILPGKIANVEGLSSISTNPHVLAFSSEYQTGDTVGEHYNFKQRFAEFVLSCTSFQQLKETIDILFHTLVVSGVDGEDMLIERFDTNLLKDYF